MFDLAKPRPKTIISLTPLIDVVFILLLFFMLATNFDTEHALEVSAASDYASPSTNQVPGKLHKLDNLTLSLDGVVLDELAIKQTLRNHYDKDPSYAVTVSVARGINVQSLFELILFTRQAGIQHVTIASRSEAVNQ